MALGPIFIRNRGWERATLLRTRGIKGNGDFEEKKTDELPTGSDTLEVIVTEGGVLYRINDSNDTVTAAGVYPLWMVVEIVYL